MTTKTCINCGGKLMQNRRAKYCGKEECQKVKQRAYYRSRHKPPAARTDRCRVCGGSLDGRKPLWVTCSPECSQEYKKNQQGAYQARHNQRLKNKTYAPTHYPSGLLIRQRGETLNEYVDRMYQDMRESGHYQRRAAEFLCCSATLFRHTPERSLSC